jgi:hypothetical protein
MFKASSQKCTVSLHRCLLAFLLPGSQRLCCFGSKNAVLNYTEMEAKVHEATNSESWGASSTLMQEIAQGTYHLYDSFLLFRHGCRPSAMPIETGH